MPFENLRSSFYVESLINCGLQNFISLSDHRCVNMILNFGVITEIKSVAALLGVSGVALYRGFTTRTRNTRGQLCKSLADVNTVCILPRKCSVDL